MKGQAMSDTRQVLEEAYQAIYGVPGLAWFNGEQGARFRRFLDAEAWTDAALMLVPEGKGFCIMGNAAKVGKHVGVGDTPALALAQAALRAKEAGDV